MKKNSIKTMEQADITAKMAEIKSSLVKFRLQSRTGKVKNVKEGKTLRKEIARMQTELRARALQNK